MTHSVRNVRTKCRLLHFTGIACLTLKMLVHWLKKKKKKYLIKNENKSKMLNCSNYLYLRVPFRNQCHQTCTYAFADIQHSIFHNKLGHILSNVKKLIQVFSICLQRVKIFWKMNSRKQNNAKNAEAITLISFQSTSKSNSAEVILSWVGCHNKNHDCIKIFQRKVFWSLFTIFCT